MDAPAPGRTDRCPYVRALDEGFTGCRAFIPHTYQTVDFAYRPTAPIVSCGHLDIGAVPGRHGFYPRCGLGDAAARERWVATISEETLEDLRMVSAEYRAWVQPRMGALWTTKSRYLAARSTADRAEVSAAAGELRAAVAELLREAKAFLENRSERLRRLGLAPDLIAPLIELATERWAFGDLAGGADYQVPDDVLERFPPRVRLFITAGRPAIHADPRR